MNKTPSGTYRRVMSTPTEPFNAFVPHPLPPSPRITFERGGISLLHNNALLAVGELNGISKILPDKMLFIYSYVRKEAVLSSQIEGTQSSLSDLMLFEDDAMPGVPLDDVKEVSNYVVALSHGLKRLTQDDFPLCSRLIREIHEKLLCSGRGSKMSPGEFRITQNWLGGSRPGNALFVPPPPEEVIPCMSQLESFFHDESTGLSPLIRAGLIHVQFETIHPFLDGNGRVGRLLIPLLLCSEGVLRDPLLYLSLYFKANRDEYYSLLQKVRVEGDWEAWIAFFLKGVMETAKAAVETSGKLLDMFSRDRERIRTSDISAVNSALLVHEELKRKPIAKISLLSKGTGLTPPTVAKALDNLGKLGLVKEITGRPRYRFFVYDEYMNVLSEGTEPL